MKCNKSIDNTVEQTDVHSLVFVGESQVFRQPSFYSIAVTLDLVLKSHVTQRAALFWIFSIWSVFFLEKGSHMGDAYSNRSNRNQLVSFVPILKSFRTFAHFWLISSKKVRI